MINDFWAAMSDSDFVKCHDFLPSDADGRKRVVPLGFHGDAGAFSKQDSLFTFTWNSLAGEGVSMSKRFVFTVIKKTELAPETYKEIFRIFRGP